MKLMISGVIFSAAMREIAFVFAVLIVDDHQHAPGARFFDGFLHRNKRHILPSLIVSAPV